MAMTKNWKLVPVEPTREMMDAVDAAYEAFEKSADGAWLGAASVYRAMLSAAPATASVDAVATEREACRHIANAMGYTPVSDGVVIKNETQAAFYMAAKIAKAIEARASLSPAATSGSEDGGEDTIAALRHDLWEAKYALAQSQQNAQAWHRVCQAIATALGLPEPDADFANVVRDWSERALAKPASEDVREVIARAIFDRQHPHENWESFSERFEARGCRLHPMQEEAFADADVALAALSSSAGPAVEQYRWRFRDGSGGWSAWFDCPPPCDGDDIEIETRTLYAHPAPAAVEMREILAKFLDYADADYVPNDLFDRARAVLAPATEGRKS